MTEILYVGFWTLTYVLIIIASYKSRRISMVSMPYIAGILNLAWESCALISTPTFWGYYPWIVLDVIIAYIGYRFLSSKKDKYKYTITIILSTIFLHLLTLLWESTLIISVYAIDLIMAILYILQLRSISPKLRITIAITRLLGDLFAAVEVLQSPLKELYPLVIIVFILNCIYLVMTILERSRNKYDAYHNHSKQKHTSP